MATDTQARTRLAREAVINAARTLFLERGYAATTMDAISSASGVPSATVYRLFSSKLQLLRSLLDVIISGADETTPLLDRPHVQAIFSSPDPRQQVSGLARVVREINVRGTGIFTILVSAASSDPKAAGLLAEFSGRREQGQGQLPRSLARMGALRPGLREKDAADIVHALASPEVYRLLVVNRGWSPQAYERWLATTLISQLLPEGDIQ